MRRYHVEKRRITRMPSGNNRTADWKQVETIDSEESVNAVMAIQ